MDFDPDGKRLPIKVDTASNGEYAPQPLSPMECSQNTQAREFVGKAAKLVGLGRRAFLKTCAGSAATLLACNQVNARAGVRGGFFDIPREAAWDLELAENSVGGDQFIFDIQTHCVDPSGNWRQGADGQRWDYVLNQVFAQRRKCGAGGYDCYSAEQLVKEVFLDSDTDIAVVSALWGARKSNPTPIEYAAEARAIVSTLGGRHRALIHGGVLPNEPGALDFMEVQARDYQVDAWKIYPQWGPEGTGFYMDDPGIGVPFIERARELGVKVICAHRGVPLGGLEYCTPIPRTSPGWPACTRMSPSSATTRASSRESRKGPMPPSATRVSTGSSRRTRKWASCPTKAISSPSSEARGVTI